MAKRYCGEVQVILNWKPAIGQYLALVCGPRNNFHVSVGRAHGAVGLANGSAAYDEAASAALQLVIDMTGDPLPEIRNAAQAVADAAASGISQGKYHFTRKVVDA